jgi:hypothetical protein
MGDETKAGGDNDDAALGAEAGELYRKLAFALLPVAPLDITKPEPAVPQTGTDEDSTGN